MSGPAERKGTRLRLPVSLTWLSELEAGLPLLCLSSSLWYNLLVPGLNFPLVHHIPFSVSWTTLFIRTYPISSCLFARFPQPASSHSKVSPSSVRGLLKLGWSSSECVRRHFSCLPWCLGRAFARQGLRLLRLSVLTSHADPIEMQAKHHTITATTRLFRPRCLLEKSSRNARFAASRH